jgi:hypothetical protein
VQSVSLFSLQASLICLFDRLCRRFDDSDDSFKFGFLSDLKYVVVDRLEGTIEEQDLLNKARSQGNLRELILSSDYETFNIRGMTGQSLGWCLRRMKYPHPYAYGQKGHRTKIYIGACPIRDVHMM